MGTKEVKGHSMIGGPNRDISSDPLAEKYQEASYRASRLEAERDRLREQNKELVEALQAVLNSVPFTHMHLPLKTRIESLLVKKRP